MLKTEFKNIKIGVVWLVMSAPLLAQSGNFPGRMAGIAQGCLTQPQFDCLATVDLVLAEVVQQILDEERDRILSNFAIDMVGIVEESSSDVLFETVAIALQKIAAAALSPDIGDAILVIAGIIERQDLVIIQPDIFLASAN